jgi:hypothetical protein
MRLPDPGSARTWGGKLLVDRDGAEIGICTEIFLDDATGMPEWATADLGGGPAFIPLVDAVESGPRVRVAVRGVDVAGAPSVGDVRHLSEDEEERLYRHYGIEYSRGASDTLLPADAAPVAVPAVSSAAPTAATTPAEGLDEGVASGRPGPDARDTAQAATSRPAPARRLLLPALGLVAAVGAITGGVLRSRRRRPQPPPPRWKRLAARARATSLAVDGRKHQAVVSAAPLLQTGRRMSLAAARRTAMRAEASILAARAKAVCLPPHAARVVRRSG